MHRARQHAQTHVRERRHRLAHEAARLMAEGGIRDFHQAKLKAAGIPTVVHYPIPLNQQPAVADAAAQLPVGDSVAQQVLSLPMHPYLTPADQQTIVAALQQAGA